MNERGAKINDKLVTKTVGKINKIIIVMPAYNAASTIKATIKDIPPGCYDEIILVDDCSTDDTVAIAQSLGITVVRHERNQGYGANQKTCYRLALEKGADAVVMLHPDYQYDARTIPHFIGFLETGVCDLMLGSRIRTRRETLNSKMPLYKYLANRMLTFTENVVLGQNLGDFHSGFRCYTRQVLETIPFEKNSDDFVFDSQFLAQAAWFGFKIGDAPIPCRYFSEASSINFIRSSTYGLLTLNTLLQFILQKARLARWNIFEPDEKEKIEAPAADSN